MVRDRIRKLSRGGEQQLSTRSSSLVCVVRPEEDVAATASFADLVGFAPSVNSVMDPMNRRRSG